MGRWSEGSRGRRGSERSKVTRKAFRARKCRRWSRKGGMVRGRTAHPAAAWRRPRTPKARSTPKNSDLNLKYTTPAISQLCGRIYGVSRVQKFFPNNVKFKYIICYAN